MFGGAPGDVDVLRFEARHARRDRLALHHRRDAELASPTSCTEAHQRLILSAYSGFSGRRLRSFGRLLTGIAGGLVRGKYCPARVPGRTSPCPARRPVSSDATVTTVVMPMTMPSTVSSERKRCAHTRGDGHAACSG